jgi:DNA-binding LacI/PurR family transcriptional regulator
MYDVARLAGVSHQTVSRVINGAEHVRAQTRERVLAAMEQLDYRPNSVARALVTGRSRTLGVVTFDTTLYGPASTLAGIERAAHAAGYFVTIVSLESLDRDAVRRAVDRLQAVGVDGVLLISPMGARLDLPAELPLVAVEAGPDELIPIAAVDQYQGARLATEHLLDLGHETVHHLAGPRVWTEAQRRVEGWRDALAAAGAAVPPLARGDWSPGAGSAAGRATLGHPAVSAGFVANDQRALGLLRALPELGRDVPGDVCVVGFDDIPEAEFFTPPLTTVRQDFNEMGRRALHLLLAEISTGTRSRTRAIVPAQLIERDSTRRRVR